MTNRKLTLLIPKVVSSNFQPDTGRTVLLKTDEGSPATVGTVSEIPSGSGHYVADFAPTPKFGFWYVDGVKKDNIGRKWLGLEKDMRPPMQHMFRKVKVFDNADTPKGNMAAPKVFTTGTSPLATSADGIAIFEFINVPFVTIGKVYQDRQVFVSTDESLTGANVTFQTAVSDVGDDDTPCYADIIIVSRD
jgi:hypothetical protein